MRRYTDRDEPLLCSGSMRVACLVLLLALAPLRVSAQELQGSAESASADAPEPSTSADLALRAALEAYESGDLVRAETLLAEVHAQQPSARTLRGLGIVAYRQARYPEAVSLLERSLVHPIKPLTEGLEAGVRELLFDAAQRVGKLELTVEPEDASIVVDSTTPSRGASGALLLMPGAHELELSAPNHEGVKLGISASAGVKQSMRVALRALPVPVDIETEVPSNLTVSNESQDNATWRTPSPLQTPSPRTQRLKRASYWLFAGSGAALVAAGAVAIRAHSKVGDIEDYCREQPGQQCEPGEVAGKERQAKLPLLEALATASLITAGATGVMGGGLYVSAWRSEVKPRSATYLLGFSRRF